MQTLLLINIILTSLLFIAILIITMILGKHSKNRNDLLKDAINNSITHVIDHSMKNAIENPIRESISVSIASAIKNSIADVLGQMNSQYLTHQQTLINITDIISNYDNSDTHKENEFRKFINTSNDKLRSSIIAFIRMPTSKVIFDSVISNYLIIYDKETRSNMKLNLISQMNNLIDKFEANCGVLDLAHLDDTKKLILEKSDSLIQEIEMLDHNECKKQIQSLKVLLSNLEKNEEITDDDYRKVQLLDEKINKDLLKRNNDLANTYNEQIKYMKQIISDKENKHNKEQAQKVRNYNEMALDNFKLAIEKFLNDSAFKHGERLEEISNLLGGFKQNLLFPEVAMYFSYVYGEIFGKLKPEGKIHISQLMLNTQERDFQ